MHELSQIETIVSHIRRKLSKENPHAKVTKINFSLGKDAHGNPDGIKTCFEVATKDTPLENAEVSVSVIEGDKMFVESIEVESEA